MGLRKELMQMSREFKKDPHKQYFKQLQNVLDISKTYKIPKKEVLKYVEKWNNK